MNDVLPPSPLWERAAHHLGAPWDHLVRRVASWCLRRLLPLAESTESLGNYRVDPSLLGPDSIVYSAGVGDNLHFDSALHRRTGCRVHAFDPSPLARRTVDHGDYPFVDFHPWGLWVRDEIRPFFAHHGGPLETQHLSTVNVMRRSRALDLECRSLATTMRDLGHQRLDLLKMDIEGAALPVLEDLLEGTLRPRQVVFELEKGRQRLVPFYRRVFRLLRRFRREGYGLQFLPRPHHQRHNLEFLATREAGR